MAGTVLAMIVQSLANAPPTQIEGDIGLNATAGELSWTVSFATLSAFLVPRHRRSLTPQLSERAAADAAAEATTLAHRVAAAHPAVVSSGVAGKTISHLTAKTAADPTIEAQKPTCATGSDTRWVLPRWHSESGHL